MKRRNISPPLATLLLTTLLTFPWKGAKKILICSHLPPHNTTIEETRHACSPNHSKMGVHSTPRTKSLKPHSTQAPKYLWEVMTCELKNRLLHTLEVDSTQLLLSFSFRLVGAPAATKQHMCAVRKLPSMVSLWSFSPVLRQLFLYEYYMRWTCSWLSHFWMGYSCV